MGNEDKIEKLATIITDVGNGLEAIGVSIKKQVADVVKVNTVQEKTFNILKFEAQKGAKIGDFEVAYKAQNLPDKWNHAYQILRQANSTISSRYCGDDFGFSYWLYGDGKIYRQKLRAPNRR